MGNYNDGTIELTGYRLSDFDVGLGFGALVEALSDKPNNYTYQDRAALVRIAAFLKRTKGSDTLFITTEDPLFYVFVRLILPSQYSLDVKAGPTIKRKLKKNELINDVSKHMKLTVCQDLRTLLPDYEGMLEHRRVVFFLNAKEDDLVRWSIRQGRKNPESTLVLMRDYSLSKNQSVAPLTREIGGIVDERADGLGEYIP